MPRGFAGEDEAGRANDPSGGGYQEGPPGQSGKSGGKSGGGGGQNRSGMKDTLDKYREEKTKKEADKQAAKKAAAKAKTPPPSGGDKGPTDRQQAFGVEARQVTTVDPKSTKAAVSSVAQAKDTTKGISAAEALSPTAATYLDTAVPVFDEDGTMIGGTKGGRGTGSTDADEEFGPMSQSKFEEIMEITDVDPYGKGNMSTGLGRGVKQGISSLSDFLSALTGKPVDLKTSYPNMSQTKKDFIRNQAYEKYLDPFGQAKVLTTMKNYNLTDEEQKAYDAAAKAQGTSSPMQVMTEQDYAQDLANRGGNVDPSRFAYKPNEIRRGLSVGDVTQYGPVKSRPRDIGKAEMLARGAAAFTPIGLPLGILAAATDLDKVKGIEGLPDPVTGAPFKSAPDKDIFQQGIDLFTGGVGTTALSQANQAAQDLLSGQGIFNTTAAQSLPSLPTSTEVTYGGDVPNTGLPGSVKSREMQKQLDAARLGSFDIGIGSDTPITDLTKPSFLDYFSSPQDQGDQGDGDPILLPTDIEPEEIKDDTNTIQPMNNLFAQEIYGGLKGPFVVPPPNFGISALPSNQANRPAFYRPAKFTV